jgi:hypothetical protein
MLAAQGGVKMPLALKAKPSGLSPRRAYELSPRKISGLSPRKLESPFELDEPISVLASARVMGKLDELNSDIEELPDEIGK